MGKNKQFHSRNNLKKNNKPSHFRKGNNFKWQNNQRSGGIDQRNNLREDEIGITEYVSADNPGFTGILRQRISDFHVNEIDLDGNTVKLTDFHVPKPPKGNEETAPNTSALKELITEKKFGEIEQLANEEADKGSEVLIDVTSIDKTKRTLIHNTIRETFNRISSSTFDQNDKKFIKCTKQKGQRDDHRTKWLWPHEYTYFLLHKDNVDTMAAVSALAPLLKGARASAISYAGTKDKRARTTQWACIRRREPELIAKAGKRLPNIFVGNFTFKDQPLKLGQLQGNRFRIALRNITADESIIIKSVENLAEKGFINYYGLQRFGNHSSIPTHQIGLALVKGQFKEACELILKPRENDIPFMTPVRECWWKSRNAQQALDLMGRRTGQGNLVEERLLAGFIKNGPNDFVNSLENVPRNTRLMYIHAYQSLIWNEMVSRRIKEFGLGLKQGDLVYTDNKALTEIIGDELTEQIDEDNDEDNDTLNQNQNDNKESENLSRFRTMVKPLTQEDINSGCYSIFDVVMPLPGFDITYPTNECNQWYEERLAKDELSSEKLKQKHKAYSLTGAYRKMLVKPSNISWYFLGYDKDTDPLIRSDLEELRGEPKIESKESALLKALVLDFSLPSSSYATMTLREILRTDTSPAHQIKLQENVASKRVATDDLPAGKDCDDAKKAKLMDAVELS